MRELTKQDMNQAVGGVGPAVLLVPSVIKFLVALGGVAVGYFASEHLKQS